jgi:4-hydroxy-4-methyl-2-oxoglutarate aldolase
MSAETTSYDPFAKITGAYSGAVYDVLRAMGYPNQALPNTILPMTRGMKVCGPVFTVEGHPDPEIGAHESLLQWTAMLSKAPSGHVVMCQPNDSIMAHMGELSAETFHGRGVLGYIVDGGCRDTDFIEKIGFKVWYRYTTPIDVVGRWKAERFGEPIVIGGVTIHTGDVAFADRDGIVVIPQAVVEAVVAKVAEVLNTENKVRTAIVRDGWDPQKAYLEYGKF